MSIIYATGFEMGTLPIANTDYSGNVSLSGAKTGSYALRLRLQNATANFNITSVSHFYESFWFFADATTNFNHVLSSVTVLTRSATGGLWTSPFQVGTISTPNGTWTHVQVYFHRDAVNGRVKIVVDGLTSVDFTGNTGTGSVSQARFVQTANVVAQVYIDDLVIRDDQLPGDVRIIAHNPNADTATINWTPSTGGDNYDLVDEVPANDSDYVYTSTDGLQDLYTVTAQTYTDLTISGVVQWIRARKETADTQQIKILLKSGATLDTGAAIDLLTTYAYYSRILETDPDTGLAWVGTDLNSVEIGIESVV